VKRAREARLMCGAAVMLATARNVGEACASLKAGKWERSRLVGVEMQGKTLGIIGLGKGA